MYSTMFVWLIFNVTIFLFLHIKPPFKATKCEFFTCVGYIWYYRKPMSNGEPADLMASTLVTVISLLYMHGDTHTPWAVTDGTEVKRWTDSETLLTKRRKTRTRKDKDLGERRDELDKLTMKRIKILRRGTEQRGKWAGRRYGAPRNLFFWLLLLL